MNLDDFEAHLNHIAPGFRCYECGDRDEKLVFIARVDNRIRPAANASMLVLMEHLLGSVSEAMKPFYMKHDGVLMYDDRLETKWSGGVFRSAGMKFFPVENWEQTTQDMQDMLSDMGWKTDDTPNGMIRGVAFGEIPHSGNYFAVETEGTNVGKVFYIDHDDCQGEPIAQSFQEFLDSIVLDPVDFMNRHGCYTSYSDGITDIQWIPQQYIADLGT